MTIPNSVISIESKAFFGCTELTSITISNSDAKISRDAFSDTGWWNNQTDEVLCLNDLCLGYKDKKPTDVSIKEGIRKIAREAFSYCRNLTSVIIPKSVTEIGSEAFYGCANLTSVTIPDSVTSIGENAFAFCDSLALVTIGKSVQTIGEYAFHRSNLKKIIFLNSIPPILENSESFIADNYSKVILYTPEDSYAKYFANDVYGRFNIIKKIETLVSSIKLKKNIKLKKGISKTLSVKIYPKTATISDCRVQQQMQN